MKQGSFGTTPSLTAYIGTRVTCNRQPLAASPRTTTTESSGLSSPPCPACPQHDTPSGLLMCSSTQRLLSSEPRCTSKLRRVWVLLRTLWPLILGNSFEFYEFSIYAFFLPYLSKVLVRGNQVASWALQWMVFVARPVGGVLLGWVADRWSRRSALIASLTGCVVTTTLHRVRCRRRARFPGWYSPDTVARHGARLGWQCSSSYAYCKASSRAARTQRCRCEHSAAGWGEGEW